MLDQHSVDYQQRLLRMYRDLLAEHLRQRAAWDRFDVPEYLRNSISSLRDRIVQAKGTLRGWGVTVDDHPDDAEPDDDLVGDVQHQRGLLRIHRGNLATLLRQREAFGAEQAPPIVVNGLQQTRADIQRVKAILRGWGVAVEDQAGEEEA